MRSGCGKEEGRIYVYCESNVKDRKVHMSNRNNYSDRGWRSNTTNRVP